MKTIYFTVTNDLIYDQRMQRICTSLAQAGYNIVLVGRRLKTSLPLQYRNFKQVRLSCLFSKGFVFYAEYNLRLFFFLLFKKMDGICAIDLDTILPCLFVSGLKRTPRIYDAHEYFTELKEVHTRPVIKRIWKWIERLTVPKFKHGYTVSDGIANQFRKEYKRNYEVIRNMPVLKLSTPSNNKEKILLYQGAVNEGRGFEYLISAMKHIPYRLVICGDGNFMPLLKQLIKENGVEHKVDMKGMLLPDDLRVESANASLGIALAEKEGLNQFMALPNKFFDYMHAGLPQIAMAFPEYEKINSQYKVAVLLSELTVDAVAQSIFQTMNNDELLNEMRANCLEARMVFNWERKNESCFNFTVLFFADAWRLLDNPCDKNRKVLKRDYKK